MAKITFARTFLAALAASSSVNAVAQDVPAESDAVNDGDIVVTAQRREQSLLDVPVAVAQHDYRKVDGRASFTRARPTNAPALMSRGGVAPSLMAVSMPWVGGGTRAGAARLPRHAPETSDEPSVFPARQCALGHPLDVRRRADAAPIPIC